VYYLQSERRDNADHEKESIYVYMCVNIYSSAKKQRAMRNIAPNTIAAIPVRALFHQ
jgi:hypothetical protein